MTKERTKRRRIFYVLGMISLVLIPLFCLYHFYKVNAFRIEGAIKFYSPPDSVMTEKFLAVKRNYRIIDFNNSLNLEHKKIKNLQFALRKLNKENDTVNGIKIHLDKKAKYEVYVKVLEILELEKMPYYMPYKDDFLVLMMPKPKKSKVKNFVCGLQYLDMSEEDLLEEERKKQFENIIALVKNNLILFLGYLGIVLINIFALVKFNKKENYNQKEYI
ncbi:hypothetical protein [Flavobacterium hungaricum]|uniref:Transmembrane protein n=1 Tax=Flavobacterium hungaricum TaxID=2082725 RepID=A0ABR9TSK5_9FLAO|nr:hypothetical protein [Flavobacterium hungaricum]MBE8728022.1 hypothetical protein [Flavobacterium hungaricum]